MSVGQHIAELIPNARLEVMLRCGHWPQFERVGWRLANRNRPVAGDLDHLAGLQDADITREAGAGGHEARTWLAAAAALAAAGPYHAQRRYYRPIAPWIAGFGVVTAQTT